MTNNNLALWEKLGRTDPAHTKTFKRGGGFAGTAIKPMWSYKRMTEEFGPCGQGWGVGEPSFQVVPGPDGEVLVYCTASIWYGHEKALVFGVGGDKAVGKNKYGLNSDDEAFKKAFTDAITNALKMIGVGADVHMGLFDDSKYVNSMRDEFAEERPQSPSKKDARPVFTALVEDLRKLTSKEDIRRWISDPEVKALRQKLPTDWDAKLRDEAAAHGRSIESAEQKEHA